MHRSRWLARRFESARRVTRYEIKHQAENDVIGDPRLSSRPSTATPTHQPPTQNRLTCKPLDLYPTDWYGLEGAGHSGTAMR